ncbi:hypothetical protein [Nitrobacter hamburgensis]|uniref:hypothetical protein n=1 Tax=Nitrobacter hamburgensis TaxID=912 RepID=UPI00059CE440|nr:hypothetical protein [Nitrobacter hamburgensis]
MAKNQNDLAGSAPADKSGGRPSGFLADEGAFDRRTLWRLGSWGAGSVGAVIVALLAHNSGAGLRHEQTADLARQSQQIQSIAKANENETRRLSSAIDTLNRDRDRLFARVTVLEQGLDSVTGSISQNAAQPGPRRPSSHNEVALGSPPAAAPLLPQPDKALPAPAGLTPPLASAAAETAAAKLSPAAPSPAKSLSANTPSKTSPSANSSSTPALPETNSPAAAATPVTPKAASQPATAAQDSPATRTGGPDETAAITPAKSEPRKNRELHKSKDAGSKAAQIVTASIPAIADARQAPPLPAHIPVAHTDFGVDLGSASSIKGLRALWRSVLKSEAKELTSLHPIIVLKGRSKGGGVQMRLVAGPLADAAAAAKICAVLSENGRACETAVFDGQHLAMNEDGKESGAAATTKKPRPAHTSSRHRHNPRSSARTEEPAPPPPPPPPPKPSPFGSFFSH